MKKIALVSSTLFVLPFVAHAQGTLAPIQTFIISVGNIIALLIPIAIGAAMVVFFWGLILYIKNPVHKEGVKMMVAGLLSLFIMVSIWGIIKLIQTALLGSSTQTTQINAPHFPTN